MGPPLKAAPDKQQQRRWRFAEAQPRLASAAGLRTATAVTATMKRRKIMTLS